VTVSAMPFTSPTEEFPAIHALLDVHNIAVSLARRTVHFPPLPSADFLAAVGGLSQYIHT
jgi:hypothetical protein